MSLTGVRLETERAGASAYEQAILFEDAAEALNTHVRILSEGARANHERAQRYLVGAKGERSVAFRLEKLLTELGWSEWHLLADRRRPGTNANLDLMLVGPPGVLIVDAKRWAAPHIADGSLFNGEACEDDQVDGVRDQAESVAEALAEIGLAPAAVRPMLVLASHDWKPMELRGVTVVGAAEVRTALARLSGRLGIDEISRVVAALNVACPPRSASSARPDRVLRPRQAPGDIHQDQASFLSHDDIWDAARAVAEQEPIEGWMIWLHPSQAQLVTSRSNGPARIRGVAGSGKTVVALHKAAYVSRQPGARVLVTTFVRNLPLVQRALFARLSPSTADQVEFASLHTWALRLLAQRGERADLGVPGRDAASAWSRAWAASHVGRELFAIAPDTQYWKDEVSRVIKGRGLRSLDDYLSLDRIGRRTPLRAEQRRLVWTLFEQYQTFLAEDGIHDYDDVIDAALASVRAEPVEPAYSHVIVDEAQDLSCQGMRLLHALVGDRPDGLLVVGDGQQAVYAGGYTLKEAGVSVTGRSTILTRNYRNGSEIVRAAIGVVGDDEFSDLDIESDTGARGIETERSGGTVRRFPSVDARSQRVELLADLRIQLDHGVRAGDIALLARTTTEAERWRRALAAAGIPATDLARYDGTSVDAVKVGTYQRAKGLEFAQVYLPNVESAVTRPHGTVTEDSLRERNQIERRCLFVAMTRARDRLWLGTVAAA